MRHINFDLSEPLRHNVSGQLNSAGSFLHHRRTFEYDVLIMVTEGQLHISANGIPYTVEAGQYILLKAGEEHFGTIPSSGKLSYMWSHFTAEAGNKNNYPLPETGSFSMASRAPLLFRQLLDLSIDSSPYSGKMSDYALSLLMLELVGEHLQSTATLQNAIPPVVVQITDWIKTHYFEPFSVTALADIFDYQPNYLSTLFKKHMGISIIGYANKIRIETAKNLLANYDLTIKETAYSCGFPDEKYFMRLFKKTEGITPSEYKTVCCFLVK